MDYYTIWNIIPSKGLPWGRGQWRSKRPGVVIPKQRTVLVQKPRGRTAGEFARTHVALVVFTELWPDIHGSLQGHTAPAGSSETYGFKQQAFIDFVLGQYVAQGVDELAPEKLTPLLRLRYNNALADAATDLGSPEQIRQTFMGFQRFLYGQP